MKAKLSDLVPMRFFRCQHPAESLWVEKPHTIERKDPDFDTVTYHLFCRRCRAPVVIKYATFVGGVPGFLSRK